MIRSLLSLAAVFSRDTMPTGQATVANCAPDSRFKINSISLDPPTAAPGQVTVLHLDYTVPESTYIYDGVSTFTFSLNGIPFAPTTEPLCGQVTCPLMPGNYVNTTQSSWPQGISGKIVTSVRWYDVNQTELLCFQITAKL